MSGITYHSGPASLTKDSQPDSTLRLRFGWYSVVFSILVASHHVFGFESLYGRYSVLRAVADFWKHGISLVSSEAFFILSGYLFFKGFRPDWGGYRGKMLRRVKTLLVPYLFWVSLGAFDSILFKEQPLSLANVASWLGLVSKYPSVIALWYVRDLLLLCILSPLLFLLIKRKWIGFGCLALFSSAFLIEIPWYLEILRSAFWFGTGAYLVLHGSEQFLLQSRRPWLLLMLWLSAVFASRWIGLDSGKPTPALEALLALTGIPVIWNLLGHLNDPNLLGHILPHVFLYYCVHMKLVDFLAAIWLRVFPTTEVWALAGFFFVPILSFLLCVIAGEVAQRYVPGFYGIITGGRGTRRVAAT